MTGIKFCGLTRHEDALLSVELGASHVGAILTESRRKVSVEHAARLFQSVDHRSRCVAVLGPDSHADAVSIVAKTSADVIQLHDVRSARTVERIKDDCGVETWCVVGIDLASSALPPVFHELAEVSDAIVLDSMLQGRTGGTGVPIEWDLLAPDFDRLASHVSIVLAGGLNPSNVGSAIAILSPRIVDVSSGVESAPGVKDPKLMRAFAEAVRSASIE
ncbi:MAG TPA: phosphoribosylanthranilate isomerase [Gemmatimonadaceae bacterium]|nr:phosphoribosylanthranilate isomerase [Gemmatimonadaceae bacterium]